MEKSKVAKIKKEKLPSLQECFKVVKVSSEFIEIKLDYAKMPEIILEYLEIPKLYSTVKYSTTVARFYHSTTDNCQVSTLILNNAANTLNYTLITLSTPINSKGVFNKVNKKKYQYVFNEFLKYFCVIVRNDLSFRSKPLLLMDLNESVYKDMSTLIDFTKAKVNSPYKSSNNSNMRLLLIPINLFN